MPTRSVPSALARAVRGAGAALAALLVLAACSDGAPTAPGEVQDPPAVLPDQITCRASRETLAVSCGTASGQAGGGPSLALVAGQGRNVWLQLSNPVYDPATDTLSFEVTLRNLTAQPMGTADGLTPHPDGVRVYLAAPLPYGITARSDGTGNFTRSGQPYWQYGPADFGNGCCLKPNESTTPRRWKFHMNGAYSFLFSVGVSTPMPAEVGVLQWRQYLHRGLLPAAAADTVQDLYVDLTGSPQGIWAFGLTGVVAKFSSDTWQLVPLPDGAGRKIRRFATARTCPLTESCYYTGWGITNTAYFYEYDEKGRERFTPTYVGSGGWNAVAGSSRHNFYAVGDSGRIMVTRPSGTGDGVDWQRLASPTTADLRAVWVRPTSVWVGGEMDHLLRFDGTSWQAFPLPAGTTVVDIQGEYYHTQAWAAATRNGGSGPESFIFRFDGTSWSQVAGPIPTELRSIGVRNPYSEDANFITDPTTDVYAVGTDRVLHWNGLAWSEQYLDRRGESLFSVAGATNSWWAVGGSNGSVWIGRRTDTIDRWLRP